MILLYLLVLLTPVTFLEFQQYEVVVMSTDECVFVMIHVLRMSCVCVCVFLLE